MSDASPASAQPNTPAAPLSIHAAAALLDSQQAAAQATPAQADPAKAAAQTETDTSREAAPEAVEDGAPEVEENAPEDEAQDDDDQSDPDGDYVEVDGEKLLVEDLVKTHRRFNDFRAQVTRKEQALAEERRALESQRQTVEQTVAETTKQVAAREAELGRIRAAVEADQQRYRQGLEAISAQANAAAAEWAKVDWQHLASEDPIGAFQKRLQYDAFVQSQRAIEAERAELDRKAADQRRAEVQRQKAALHEHITANHKELTDPEKGTALWRDMVATAKSAGLTDEIILAATGQADDPGVRVVDPANLNLWVKATLYDRLMRETQAATQPAADAKPGEAQRIRVVKGNAPRPRPGTVERARIGGVDAAFAAKPTIENALRALNARDAYRDRRRG